MPAATARRESLPAIARTQQVRQQLILQFLRLSARQHLMLHRQVAEFARWHKPPRFHSAFRRTAGVAAPDLAVAASSWASDYDSAPGALMNCWMRAKFSDAAMGRWTAICKAVLMTTRRHRTPTGCVAPCPAGADFQLLAMDRRFAAA